MLTCPLCKREIAEDVRECPRCRADLSLLVDYVEHLQDGLSSAEARTRAGDLEGAVWAYLEVLEVDPDNAVARRQVARVASAVRQFDRIASGKRWLSRLHRQARFRRWLAAWSEQSRVGVRQTAVALFVLLLVFAAGYALGRYLSGPQSTDPGSISTLFQS
jgi:hypothetical protein